jgi:hypothetical protein
VQSEFCARSDTSHLGARSEFLCSLVRRARNGPARHAPAWAEESEKGASEETTSGPDRIAVTPAARMADHVAWASGLIISFHFLLCVSSLPRSRCAVTSCGRMHGVPCGGAGFAQEYNGSSNCQSNGSDMSLDGSSFWTVG